MRLLCPQRSHHRYVLVGAFPAPLECNTECAELLFEPAHPDAESGAPAAETIERRHLLCEDKRVALREDEDAGSEADLGRRRPGKSQPNQGIRGGKVLSATCHLSAAAVGVGGAVPGRNHDVLRRPQRLEPECLRPSGIRARRIRSSPIHIKEAEFHREEVTGRRQSSVISHQSSARTGHGLRERSDDAACCKLPASVDPRTKHRPSPHPLILSPMSSILWQPTPERVEHANLTAFARRIPGSPSSYDALWRWSIEHRGEFWQAVWDDGGVIALSPPDRAVGREAMPGTEWFPGARLNFAENLLRRDDDTPAIIHASEHADPVEITWAELRDRVARARNGLIRLGVGSGDRVAALLPNGPEAVIGMLAAASIGAIWSSCSPTSDHSVSSTDSVRSSPGF